MLNRKIIENIGSGGIISSDTRNKPQPKNKRAKLEDVIPRRAPFTIFLDPSGACNFKCSFCPCNTSSFRWADRHKIMSWDLFCKIVEDIKAFEKGVKVINLHGFGEPLLNTRIPDMVQALKENECCETVKIITNGSLLNADMSQALIDAGADMVLVSIEALSGEGYRELCGVDIEFSNIVKNIETYYKLSRGTDSKIGAKIITASLHDQQEITAFYNIFSPVTDYCYMENVDENWPEFEEAVIPDKRKDIFEGYSPRGYCYSKDSPRDICSFPFTAMAIHSNGAVGVCCVDWKFATQYGDVNQEHLADIWNGRKHIELQCAHLTGKILPESFCGSCRYLPWDHIEDPSLLLKNIQKLESR